jgi:hypothetical protein
MADINNNNHKRYDSWVEYYKEKGEERTGLIRHLARADLSFLHDLPTKYVGKPAVFKENVAQYSYGNFILVPSGTNKVRCIHSCFLFGELGKPSKVVGISGSRRTSPFKTLNTEHAVKLFSGPPRTTRASEEKVDEAWIPTMEEFMDCDTVEGFKNLRSEEEDFPAAKFWAGPSHSESTQRYSKSSTQTTLRELGN